MRKRRRYQYWKGQLNARNGIVGIQYVVGRLIKTVGPIVNGPKKMELFRRLSSLKGMWVMSQRQFNSGEERNKEYKSDKPLYEPIEIDQDLLTEDVLHGIKKTPVGQLLQKIASMPEVRQDKILRVRRELSGGSYNLNDRLDVAIDNILEELLI